MGMIKVHNWTTSKVCVQLAKVVTLNYQQLYSISSRPPPRTSFALLQSCRSSFCACGTASIALPLLPGCSTINPKKELSSASVIKSALMNFELVTQLVTHCRAVVTGVQGDSITMQ